MMENLDQIIKEIRDNKYDNELAELYIKNFWIVRKSMINLYV